MKELTHEEWQENPTPRVMWVWDEYETCREKMKVLYFSEKNIKYPVIVLNDNGIDTNVYRHCAEIAKTRRMTNKELSRWLRGNPTRELKYDRQTDRVCCQYRYYDSESDKEVDPELVIRENDGEWREPLVEDNNNDND